MAMDAGESKKLIRRAFPMRKSHRDLAAMATTYAANRDRGLIPRQIPRQQHQMSIRRSRATWAQAARAGAADWHAGG